MDPQDADKKVQKKRSIRYPVAEEQIIMPNDGMDIEGLLFLPTVWATPDEEQQDDDSAEFLPPDEVDEPAKR